MMTTTFKRLAIVAGLAVALSVPAIAQTQNTTGAPPFVAKLLTQLSLQGWSPAAQAALVKAATQLDWHGTAAADPQVVALALQYGERQNASLGPTVQAQIALRLALSTVQMEQVGMSQQSSAVAALGAVRDSLPEIEAAIANHTPGSGVGNIFGKAVSAAVRNQIQATVRVQADNHSSVGRGLAQNAGIGAFGPPSGTPVSSTPASGGVPGPKGR